MLLHGDQSKTNFGPTWLNKSRGSLPVDGVDSKDGNGKGTVNTNGKKVPLMFARSRSTPALPVEEQQHVQEHHKKPEQDFSILNGFDSNFPSLGAVKGPSSGIQPSGGVGVGVGVGVGLSRSMPQQVTAKKVEPPTIAPSSAWKGQNKATVPSNPVTPAPNATNGGVTNDTESQLASCVVPTVQAPKVLTKNKIELLKKGHLSKKKFDTSILRKATSDPSLPIPPAYQENYAKLMANKKNGTNATQTLDKSKILEKQKSGTVLLNRSDFFKGNKPDPNDPSGHRRVSSVDSVGFGQAPAPMPIFGSGVATGNNNNTNGNINKAEGKAVESEQSTADSGNERPKLENLQDEEKFLRDLGWVPEEEDHVPELTPDEIVIVEEAAKIDRVYHDQVKKNLLSSFDVSIKKWQTDRLFGPKVY